MANTNKPLAAIKNIFRPRGDRGGHWRERQALWIMMIVGLIFSGVAFAYKISEFVAAITSEDAKGFADVPVATYFFVACGWLLLMSWCFVTGRFRDTEVAKYDMLRMEEEYERRGE